MGQTQNFELPNTEKSIIQKITLPGVELFNSVFIKRDDLIHPQISGNKWRKLKHNIREAQRIGHNTIITFGGAYSNHIYATAAAGKLFGFDTIGIIRGEEHLPLNGTLSFARNNGMKIVYLNRTDYRRRNETEFQKRMAAEYGYPYIVPEGGTNKLALKGVAEIYDEINFEFDVICSAVGSGGTLAGLISRSKKMHRVIGFTALKNADYLRGIISALVEEGSDKTFRNWELKLDYHFGGFAKITRGLIVFMNEFERLNGIEIEPIYTAKMLFGLKEMIAAGNIKAGERVVVLHSGGVQGKAGMQKKINKLMEA